MTDGGAWPVRLSPPVVKALAALPAHAQEMVRDMAGIAARAPWGFAQWDIADAEGEDIRAASVGPLTLVYFINRAGRRLYVIDLVWLG
ncbi:hypothetical protein [Streptomyces albireticuli]|uniref:hypothetical protein n=1 Tax=Streptomyces albireticuli TaxID=1940 RepID=UPI001E36A63E|nr:hypothetical protein [Streptomyces albireticuli]MCD9145016.1 hypothetical protein [Streptomyces albireticuli]MCD9164442.1 hypothetical protein [Streptomyces albireticuli]MCD9194153.1 hypothetical protein [Streptomyces albireticuli]